MNVLGPGDVTSLGLFAGVVQCTGNRDFHGSHGSRGKASQSTNPCRSALLLTADSHMHAGTRSLACPYIWPAASRWPPKNSLARPINRVDICGSDALWMRSQLQAHPGSIAHHPRPLLHPTIPKRGVELLSVLTTCFSCCRWAPVPPMTHCNLVGRLKWTLDWAGVIASQPL